MNLENIIEYAIYHDNLDKKISLPGIRKGMPIKSFFFRKSKYNINDFKKLISNTINNSLKKKDNINLLCSGGVDSSLLAIYLIKNQKKFLGINNFYPNYQLNDLEKIKSLNNFYDFKVKKVKISSNNYLKGMHLSFKKNYFGNTYAPSLFYSLNSIKNDNKYLMTGSGPDELFYGMEKYNLRYFKKLSNLKTNIALEKIDTNYNFDFYKKVLNPYGREILNNVINKRKRLYKKISEIRGNLLEAQRILSYCVVTNQHFEMFEKISRNFNMIHLSPFLDDEFIRFAFSLKLNHFLKKNNKNKIYDANSGKKQMKQLLATLTSKKHAYDYKIGFHAPISNMIEEKKIYTNLNKSLRYGKLEKIINIDKLIINLKKNYKLKKKNYNIYSLLGVQKMID